MFTDIPPFAQRYYLDNRSRLSKLNLDEVLEKPCITTLVISAYNEGGNTDPRKTKLGNTISNIISQKNPDGTFVNNNSYELLVVSNASTDNTLDVVRDLAEEYPDVKILLHEEQTKGIKFAKRRAFDEGFQRSLLRAVHGRMPSYLLTTDADIVQFDPYWLSHAMDHAKKNLPGGLSGWYRFDSQTENLLPNATTILYEQLSFYTNLWQIFGRATPGANSGFHPFTYAEIDGYTVAFDHAGDLHLGNKTIIQGHTISELDQNVIVDGRRLRLNPAEFVAGMGYKSGLEKEYDKEKSNDVDLRFEDMSLFRSLRLYETIRTHFFLQCAIKPKVVFNESNKEYFLNMLNGGSNYELLKSTLKKGFAIQEAREIALDLMHLLGNTVFDRLKSENTNYSNLAYPTKFTTR